MFLMSEFDKVDYNLLFKSVDVYRDKVSSHGNSVVRY